jgi:hypothetical protein
MSGYFDARPFVSFAVQGLNRMTRTAKPVSVRR